MGMSMADQHEQIAQLAYEIYEQSGRVSGRDWDNWLEAERRIRSSHRQTEDDADLSRPDGWSFRFKIALAPRSGISSEHESLRLLTLSDNQIVEVVGKPSISKSSALILSSHGWRTADEANETGQVFADAFTLTLVKNRVGVESWPRRGGGMFTTAGLAMLRGDSGRRILNDQLGLTVHETNPRPLFAGLGPANAVLSASPAMITETFRQLALIRPRLTPKERIAVDLFNASFFEPSADTRLITLVMAVEALLEPALRPDESVALVDSFIETVRVSSLSDLERTSLIGTLRFLRKQSIRSTARQLCQDRLPGNTYEGRGAAQYFLQCYDLRSTLVHGGDTRVTKDAAGTMAAQSEVLVSDLILARFFAMLPSTASAASN
jgi:hypothetical protein